jgi:glutamate-1-semialdehyde 2,1-aminomutase
MTSPESPSEPSDPKTPAGLLAREHDQFVERTPESSAMADELADLVPAGVCSTFRAYEPYPLHAERAEGARLYDVDGNAYLDFALNNGSQLVGHAHPDLISAVEEQLGNGTLYTRPNDLIREAATALTDRIDPLEMVRFTNSGTEAVMHMTRLARAYTGCEKIIRMEGAYHGAHDLSLISKMPPIEQAGPESKPTPIRESTGVPAARCDEVLLAKYNDATSVESQLAAHADEVAAILVEPACFNLGIVEPHDGFLQRLRKLADEYDILLLFDEVKTGLKLGPGSGADYYGVEPDLMALAKAIGGGFPVGAFGGQADVMETISRDLNEGVATGAAHYGTYNGNPVALNAIATTVSELMTPDVYDRLYDLADRLEAGYEELLDDHDLQGHVVTVGTQGMVYFTAEEIRTYRDWVHVDEEFHEAYWFGMLNRGVLPHPHDASQQWTVSLQHTAADVDEHVDAFAELAPDLSRAQD